MNKEFILYEQALALKELGFDEPCLAHLIGFGDGTKENGKYKINQQQVFYPNDYISSDDKAEELGLYPFGMCGVPLYQQAFNWLRKKYDIDHIIYPHVECFKRSYLANIYIGLEQKNMKNENMVSIRFYTYEEAELACLKKLIEIVKKK
jgi:hypothetical protein